MEKAIYAKHLAAKKRIQKIQEAKIIVVAAMCASEDQLTFHDLQTVVRALEEAASRSNDIVTR